ncbi:MAG: hypothetical protein COV67_04110 [Nitrospinae bacterium CG11_big_fil_rev_8_21_14_0_20_56_8]|nr:MAG: hypothetical protein COV67_04110 [Nitrospinae bacterium CG11_big_fil_rev_8_21_14_0_20_56_8]
MPGRKMFRPIFLPVAVNTGDRKDAKAAKRTVWFYPCSSVFIGGSNLRCSEAFNPARTQNQTFQLAGSSPQVFQFAVQFFAVDHFEQNDLATGYPVKNPFFTYTQPVKWRGESFELFDSRFSGGQGGGFENFQFLRKFQGAFGRQFLQAL